MTAWWWLLARWMLVALLVVDQVSAPFHSHQHGGGVDATSLGVSAHSTSHAEGIDDGEHPGHWALAVRSASSTASSVSAARDASHFELACAACLTTEVALMTREGVDARFAYARWRPPPIQAHRSLPPNGHAPPALA
jgi:hypothetical protein